MRFTDRSITALKPKAERYEVWEPNRAGLGVRVSPAGRKSWIFMYRFGGRPRRMTLGSYPAMGLARARTKHAQAKEQLEKGSDPGTLHVERRRAERHAETVQDLADEYLEKWAKPRKRSAAEDERILNKDVLPEWGRKKAKEIKRRDVILLLDKIVERGAPIQANRTLAVVRKMFNFAVSRDILDATPVAMVRAPAKENQRDRVLTADEMRMFWTGLDEAAMSEGVRLALRLGLATAQRKGEIVGARQSEFDLEEKIWTIPAERSKNAIAHRVPLSPLAIDLVEQAKALADESDWLFPSPRGDGPITPESVNHALRNALTPGIPKMKTDVPKPAIALENVTPHDLRRSAASGMASLGIGRLVIGKILNHAESSVTAVYDRHGYDAEKRHALEIWAVHLESIVAEKPKAGNVVPLAKVSEAR